MQEKFDVINEVLLLGLWIFFIIRCVLISVG